MMFTTPSRTILASHNAMWPSRSWETGAVRPVRVTSMAACAEMFAGTRWNPVHFIFLSELLCHTEEFLFFVINNYNRAGCSSPPWRADNNNKARMSCSCEVLMPNGVVEVGGSWFYIYHVVCTLRIISKLQCFQFLELLLQLINYKLCCWSQSLSSCTGW